MKTLAYSKDQRGNELITYQFELPTYLLPEILKFKKMEITWRDLTYIDMGQGVPITLSNKMIFLTSSKEALFEFFDKCCPKYYFQIGEHICYSKKKWDEFWYKEFPETSYKKWENINQNKTTDIHLQQIAEQMYDLYNESEPFELKEGEYHIPFKNEIDYLKLGEATSKYYVEDNPSEVVNVPKWELKISTTLISNPTETDYFKLIQIHDQLVKDNELDTFVHCEKVMDNKEYFDFFRGNKEYQFTNEEKYLYSFG